MSVFSFCAGDDVDISMLKWCVHHGGRFCENQGFVSWWKERAGWGGEGRGLVGRKKDF